MIYSQQPNGTDWKTHDHFRSNTNYKVQYLVMSCRLEIARKDGVLFAKSTTHFLVIKRPDGTEKWDAMPLEKAMDDVAFYRKHDAECVAYRESHGGEK